VRTCELIQLPKLNDPRTGGRSTSRESREVYIKNSEEKIMHPYVYGAKFKKKNFASTSIVQEVAR
jgi:hypothetical protein